MPNQAIEKIEYPRQRKFITDDSLDILDIFKIIKEHGFEEVSIQYLHDLSGYHITIRSAYFEDSSIFLKHHVEECGPKFIYDCIDKMIEELLLEEKKRGNKR